MIPYRKANKASFINNRGFSLVEVMFVVAIISVISTIAFTNYIPIKKKAYDAVAQSDAQNLADSVVIATLAEEDVDYTKTDTGGPVGELESDGATPRSPVFTLSPGVRATIIGTSVFGPNGTAFFSANIYHIDGTKVFLCVVDEAAGTALIL